MQFVENVLRFSPKTAGREQDTKLPSKTQYVR